jgi:predicted lipoprotein with Yx(FWY)xxD motif
VIVSPDWTVGPELDSGIFSTVPRQDGTEQLVAGKFPLYYFSGDSAPGDHNGQGSGDVWFVVGQDAKLVTAAAPANGAAAPTTAPAAAPAPAAPAAAATSVKLADSALGKIVVDAKGRTLYGFTKDENGTSTCSGGCAQAWPPSIVQGAPVAPGGIDAKALTVVARPDGSSQLKLGKWPLYTFAGDGAPGETNGQGSGGSWFVIGADGKLIKA